MHTNSRHWLGATKVNWYGTVHSPAPGGAFHYCSLIFALLLPYYFLKRTIIVILLLPCKTFTVLLLKKS